MADPNIVDHVGLWQIVPAEQCPQVKTGLDSSFSSHSPCCFKPWKPFVTTLYNKIRLWAGNSDLFRTPFLKKVRIRTNSDHNWGHCLHFIFKYNRFHQEYHQCSKASLLFQVCNNWAFNRTVRHLFTILDKYINGKEWDNQTIQI